MKIRDGYVLNEVGDSTVAVYVGGDDMGLHGIVNLNKVGAFIWENLETGCTKDELIKAVTDKYDIDKITAEKDIDNFLDSLYAENIIVE